MRRLPRTGSDLGGGPLAGVRVIDFTELAPGPFLTQCLREMGADVLKIERPPHGDMGKHLDPGAHHLLNLGKPTRMVDLKDPQGLAEVRGLVEDADVLVESSRPGVMDRLGLGYAACNPRIVYVSLTGFGQHGTHAKLPGHDINYLAASGILSLSGTASSGPTPGVGVPMGDFAASLYALSSTVAALMSSRATGRGQHLDVSITDCLMHWMNVAIGRFSTTGLDTLALQRDAVFTKAAYGTFRTGDGQWLAIAAMEEKFWLALREALDLDLEGISCGTRQERVASSAAINRAISAAVGARGAEDVVASLRAADVPVMEVLEPNDLLTSEHARERGLVRTAEGVQYVGFPIQFAPA